MKKLAHYLSLIKFSHTVFAMPFALLGFTMGIFAQAEKTGDTGGSGLKTVTHYFNNQYMVLVWVILCMVFARSAAMAFNRYLDREFDAKNPRTAIREIPRGIISAPGALRFTILSSILFMGTAFMINTTCLLLSPIALLVVLGYSYTKRFTPLCHIILGIGLALAPAGAFIAVTGGIGTAVILLSLGVIGWVSGFDIIYAMQDDQFDRSTGLHSIPAALGRTNALWISRGLHAAAVVLIFAAGQRIDAGPVYAGGVGFFAAALILQHKLVKPDDLSKVDLAFMTTNGIASLVFSITAIADFLILR